MSKSNKIHLKFVKSCKKDDSINLDLTRWEIYDGPNKIFKISLNEFISGTDWNIENEYEFIASEEFGQTMLAIVKEGRDIFNLTNQDIKTALLMGYKEHTKYYTDDLIKAGTKFESLSELKEEANYLEQISKSLEEAMGNITIPSPLILASAAVDGAKLATVHQVNDILYSITAKILKTKLNVSDESLHKYKDAVTLLFITMLHMSANLNKTKYSDSIKKYTQLALTEVSRDYSLQLAGFLFELFSVIASNYKYKSAKIQDEDIASERDEYLEEINNIYLQDLLELRS